ncbi:MAG: hypothetical protein ABH856_02970 [Patescibacteria group bacterium]|nr:hypothetical protein [Patescibacteria group bacterium]
MNYRQLIADSWFFTQNNKRLIIWFGCVPATFEIIGGILFVGYQYFATKKSELFDYHGPSFLSEIGNFVWNFIKVDPGLGITLAVAAGIVFLLYLTLPTLFQCATIQFIARRRNKQDVTLGDGMKHGIFSFLPLIEYHAIIKIFGFFWLLTESAFILRNLGVDAFRMVGAIFLIVFLFGLLLSLLFTYTPFYIVIDRKEVMRSVVASSKLVILNLTHTFLVTILMVIIGLRIVVQLVIVLSIPAIILFFGGYLATTVLAGAGYIIGGVLGFIALLFAIYFAGIIEIFANSVWVFTFLEITEKRELSARENEQKKTLGTRHVMLEEGTDYEVADVDQLSEHREEDDPRHAPHQLPEHHEEDDY